MRKDLFFSLLNLLLRIVWIPLYSPSLSSPSPLFLLSSSLSLSLVSSLTSSDQIIALEALYDSTNGENWNWRNETLYGPIWSFSSNSSLQSQTDPCNTNMRTWQGIRCSSGPIQCITMTCNIVSIILTSYDLNGSIPEEIYSVESLSRLSLNDNILEGSISSRIGLLTNLNYFELHLNQIRGSLPSSFGSLSRLLLFSINNNQITGILPSSFGSLNQLQYFDFNSNRISGTIPSVFGSLYELLDFTSYRNKINGTIPSSLGYLSKLQSLDLNSNQITGTLPPSLGSLNQLLYFIFYDNKINGTLPSSFGSISLLRYFYINNNELSGSLPSSFGAFNRLLYFDLSNNRITGSLPSSLGSLTRLLYFVCYDNQINGSLPSALGSLSQLQCFDFNNNRITGSLPSSFGSLAQLRSFLSYSNGIQGSIPSSFGLLSLLQSVYMLDNQINGSLPRSLGSWSQLQYFDISNNQISGIIPASFGSLDQLRNFVINTNQINGTLPSSFGLFSQLQYLVIYQNQISGTLPSSFGSLSQLVYFICNNNQIDGSLPSSFGSLSRLLWFSINNNQITGTLPSSFGSLNQLQYFYINNNRISGTIPSVFGGLSELLNFILDINKINGTLPSSLGSLSQLQYLDLNANQISGTLPSSLGLLSQLIYCVFNNNQINGTLPSSLGLLSELEYFYCVNNHISGSLPSSLGWLSQMQYFYLHDNHLSGTIPSSFGSLFQLLYCDMHSNQITGTLPSLNQLSNLEYFSVFSNRLQGSIPLQLVGFPHLRQFFLQQNRLSGTLDRFLESSQPTTVSLMNLDLSGNSLSGTISDTLFLIPTLETIALSVNCFEGKLPPGICFAVNVSVMSLDGLGASHSCQKRFTFPFTSVSLGRMIEGSIPSCVWNLPKLVTFHLAGNGLRGKIESEVSKSPLVNLTLSHNYLSGEIPSWLFEKNINSLDLSHNKFTGDLNDINSKVNDQKKNETISLMLGVNRLSGEVPQSFDQYSTLDILSGNLFSCDTIPKNDKNSEYYVCGSSEYNQSMMMMGGVFGVLMLLLLFYCCNVFLRNVTLQCHNDMPLLVRNVRRWCDQKILIYDQLIKYLFYYRHQFPAITQQNKERKQKVFLLNKLGKSLVEVEKLFLILTTTIIIFSIPLYLLKGVGDHLYITHYHQFQWYFTIIYLTGSIPGLLLMGLCLISLLGFRLIIYLLSQRFKSEISDTEENLGLDTRQSHRFNSILPLKSHESLTFDHSPLNSIDSSSPSLNSLTQTATSTTIQTFSYREKFSLCLIFFLNILMVGTVNGFYILSTLKKVSLSSRLLIQLSVSLFGMSWKSVLRSLFPHRMKHSFSVVWILSVIGVINGVIIPCVVIALTSPSCYQRLIVEPEDISSSYSYTYCSRLVISATGRYCGEYDTNLVNVLKLTPPFTYSYQCGSTFLLSYIPVHLYSSMLGIIVEVFRVIRSLQWNRGDPKFIRSFYLPQISSVLTNIIHNMILLLSFGLSSPLLCFGICMNAVVSVSSYLIRLGRLIFQWENALKTGYEEMGKNFIISCFALIFLEFEMKNKDFVIGEFLPGLNLNIPSDQTRADYWPDLVEKLSPEIQENLENGFQCLESSKWLIMTPCAFLITLLSWDIVGDEIGWDKSFWIPLTGIGIMLIIWISDFCIIWSRGVESQFVR